MSDAPPPADNAGQPTGALLRLHLFVYGKLIRGFDATGPVKSGAEHRMTGMSRDFPAGLREYCVPEKYFANWPGITGVDAGQVRGGAFVYRPVRFDGVHYGLFARLEARPEAGAGQPGRQYTHCATLAVEGAWTPEVIVLAAELLYGRETFGRCFGDPNWEEDKQRTEIDFPAIPVAELPAPGPETGDRAPLPFRRHADLEDAVAVARQLAAELRMIGLARTGRWLSFAYGVRGLARGPGERGFAIVGDDREAGKDDRVQLRFSDAVPPPEKQGELLRREIDWSRLGPAGFRPETRPKPEHRHIPVLRNRPVETAPSPPRDHLHAVYDDHDRAEFEFARSGDDRSPRDETEDDPAPAPGRQPFGKEDTREEVEFEQARAYFEHRLLALSETFPRYRITDDEGVLAGHLCTFQNRLVRRALTEDVFLRDTREEIRLRFGMPALPFLGLPARERGRGSVFALLFRMIARERAVGADAKDDEVDDWLVEELARTARAAAGIGRLVGRSAEVDPGRLDKLCKLFLWLAENPDGGPILDPGNRRHRAIEEDLRAIAAMAVSGRR